MKAMIQFQINIMNTPILLPTGIHLQENIRPALERIIGKCLESADPYQAVKRSMQINGDELILQGENISLKDYHQILLVAIGKAGIPMSRAVLDMGENWITDGIVITKSSGEVLLRGRNICISGNHPVPGEESIHCADQLMKLFEEKEYPRLVFFLISGGGSALVTKPIPPVTLEDMQTLTRSLLHCGASIDEINTLRKHLDLVKGGRLLGKALPADAVMFILSDVIGDRVDMIASGPTVPDTTTFRQARDILEKYQLIEQTPKSIVETLRNGENGKVEETLKEADLGQNHRWVEIIGSNRISLDAAASQAEKEGMAVHKDSEPLTGEARDAAKRISRKAGEAVIERDKLNQPVCWIFGGETTVTLHGRGRGGRNLETALASAIEIDGLKQVMVMTFATDGEDSTTGAAGAIVSGNSADDARALGLDPLQYLANNDSLTFFEKTGGLVITGSTGTNVNDLTMVIAY
jgi:hydroxypyruvate reductase